MKRVSLILAAFLFLCLLFSACGKEPKASVFQESYQLYCLDEKEEYVIAFPVEPVESSTEGLLFEFLGKMREPKEKGFVAAIPEKVSLPKIAFSINGLVTLQFDESYSLVTGTREVLMRAAIVKTLCQIKEVDSVEIYVAGQPLMGLSNTPVGIMKEDDFIDNTGEDVNYYQYVYATLYFPDLNGEGLVTSNLKIPFSGSETEEQVILKQLLDGPVEDGMKSVVKGKVKLNSVSTRDGVCTVDVSATFFSGTEDCSEQLKVFSVVNTLVELPEIFYVQFLIDGEMRKQGYGMDLSKPFERNLSLVIEE